MPAGDVRGDLDVGEGVTVVVGSAHRDGPGEAREGQETLDQAVIGPTEGLDVGAEGPGRADDEVSDAVTVDIAAGHADSAGVARERQEALNQAAVGPTEDLEVATRGPYRADDDVLLPVAVDIPSGHAHAAPEANEGQEAHHQTTIGAIEDLHVAAHAAGQNADDHIVDAVIVDVAGADADAAAKAREGQEA